MVAPFNYTPIRKTALGLIKSFGRSCFLLRGSDPVAADPTKPWRVGDPTIVHFPFKGIYIPIPLPRMGEPSSDPGEVDIIMPGDVDTDSNGNVVGVIEPLTTDRLQIIGRIGDETDPFYAIIGIHRIDPSGSPFMFKMRCTSQPFLIASAAQGL